MTDPLLMEKVAMFISESTSQTVATWAVWYALDLSICDRVSITDRACQLRVSPQALSKQIRRFSDFAETPESSYMYKKGKRS